MLGGMKLIIRWLLLAAALLLVAHLYSGVTVANYSAALMAAFVIGLFNTLVRPVLVSARVKVVVASFMQPASAYVLLSNAPRRPSRVLD